MPARAACPSEIWPVHPESTTNEIPIRAKSSTSLYRSWREARVINKGRIAAAAMSSPMPMRDEWRTHQRRSTAWGSGRVVGTNENDWSLPVIRRLATSVVAMTIRKSEPS